MSIRPVVRGFLLSGAALLPLLMVADAEAQDCGSWRQPVLCEVQLELVNSDYDRVALGGRTDVGLAPREQITLQLEARDQFGRRFPADRLALGVDDSGCGSLLSVDDRGEGEYRVTASRGDGRCTVEVWVPNNLNFYWEIDFEISAAARRGYSRSEAEFLATALYAGILGREPDASGYGAAVSEIQGENLETLLDAMTRSAEFRQSIEGLSPSDILERFYQGVLGRETDSGGSRLYLGEMRRGAYTSVLLKLIRSPEFERRLER